MKRSITRFLTEFLAWNAANILCMGLPLIAVYFLGATVLGWGSATMGFYLTVALLGSLTWGSWAALVWTRNPILRGAMHVSTLIPGVLTITGGAVGLYVGFGPIVVWIATIAAGIGMLGASLGLSRAFRIDGVVTGPEGAMFGLTLYPLATSAGGLVVGSLWYAFLSNPTGGWRSLVSVSTVMVSILAVALVTTVIPSVVSAGCRKISLDFAKKL